MTTTTPTRRTDVGRRPRLTSAQLEDIEFLLDHEHPTRIHGRMSYPNQRSLYTALRRAGRFDLASRLGEGRTTTPQETDTP